jgi:hypothetical protein
MNEAHVARFSQEVIPALSYYCALFLPESLPFTHPPLSYRTTALV